MPNLATHNVLFEGETLIPAPCGVFHLVEHDDSDQSQEPSHHNQVGLEAFKNLKNMGGKKVLEYAEFSFFSKKSDLCC